MSTLLSRLVPSAAVALTMLTPAVGVRAQERTASAALEEVTVTARRREERLMETPVSITAISAAELASRQIEQSNQIAQMTPNLVYRNVTNSSNVGGSIYIRGIGQGDWVPTVQPGVGVYMDGAYVARINGSLAEIVDIDSIQVLRGPQGTLFGRNTVGGAVLINTVKPDDVLNAYVDVKAGSFDLRQVKASVNVPIADRFYGKFSVLLRDRDGYIDTPNISAADKFPGNRTVAARAALRWLTDELTFDWSADYFKHRSDGPPMVLEAIFPSVPGNNVFQYNTIVAPALGLPLADGRYATGRNSSTNFGSEWKGRQGADIVNTTLAVQWDLNDRLTLKSISNFRDMDSEEFRDGDGTPLPIVSFDNPIDSRQFSQEINLSGQSESERLKWLLGVYYFDEDTENVSLVNFPTFHIASGAKVQNSSKAVFGQFTYEATAKASLTLGARWTDEKLDSIVDDTNQHLTSFFCATTGRPPFCPAGFVGYLTLPAPPAAGSIRIMPNGVFKSKEQRTDPYVNFSYKFTDSLMAYASYSRGFKGGGFVQRITPGNTVTTFGPEVAKVSELGVKWASTNDRVRITGAVFHTDYQDLQVPVTTRTGVAIQNASDATIKGGELEAAASLGEHWRISMGLGYLDGEYKNFRPNVQFSSNNRLPSVMEWQSNASLVYSAPVPTGRIVARLDHSFMDDYYANAQNVPGTLVPSRSVLNAGFTYAPESERWEAAVEVRNLTDRVIVEEVYGDLAANGVLMPILAPPREWAVRFRYNFGT